MTTNWTADVARQALRSHELPLPRFDFAAASNRARVRYGYPAEPDRRTQPRLWAKWERNLHRPWRRVVPEYDLQPARAIRHSLPTANTTNSSWCGAIVTPPAGKTVRTITGTWVVPDAYPPPYDQISPGVYYDGGFNSLHWIGLDGYAGAGANELLQAGTGTDVVVQNSRPKVLPSYVWFEWWYSVTNNGYAKLPNFTVNPGDVIEMMVCATYDPPDSTPYGLAVIGNVTTNDYVSQRIDSPSPTLTLAGSTAEWIVEREGGARGSGYARLANYGAIFFSDCLAMGPGYEADLSSADFVDMTDGSTTVSTALQVSNSVLECYYGTRQP